MWCVNHNTNYECKGRITYVQKCTFKYEDKSKRKKERKGEGKKVIGKKRKKKKFIQTYFLAGMNINLLLIIWFRAGIPINNVYAVSCAKNTSMGKSYLSITFYGLLSIYFTQN